MSCSDTAVSWMSSPVRLTRIARDEHIRSPSPVMRYIDLITPRLLIYVIARRLRSGTPGARDRPEAAITGHVILTIKKTTSTSTSTSRMARDRYVSLNIRLIISGIRFPARRKTPDRNYNVVYKSWASQIRVDDCSGSNHPSDPG